MSVLAYGFLAVLAAFEGRPTSVSGIMARVALNQQISRQARTHYLYRQDQTIRMRRPNGKIAREQSAEYRVTPGKDDAEKTLQKFDGRYEHKGKYVSYDKPGYTYRGLDIDGDLIQQMADDMMNDRKSRDGIGHELFPLTAQEQKNYDFRLTGKETYRGRSVYRIAFSPKPRTQMDFDEAWKGEALIDAEEYQPITVETAMAQKMPAWAKIVLGTDVKGLGFSVTYQKFDDGAWFPVSYGGEFEVRGVFFYKRNISVSMQNTDFRKTDVKSTLVYATDAH
ncbi:MAG TPA: hypothetical protein VHW09_19050 [Bryobacteraceae bacterium]|jgi:hypothetical protein|nr:hypothetical protein [Bryobacteraceae bacterium]